MKSLYDPETEAELQDKTFTYREVYDIIDFVHLKTKKIKYLTVFIAGIWTPIITLMCWVKYQHPAVFIIGALTSTFMVYVFDETHDSIFSYLIRKLKKNAENKRKK